jgi:hypothetical protein
VNYTREPIIETVITPREGCKLAVRSSKGNNQQEDYFVDAVEVVSFGQALFFRSQERPKSFLLPVTDYEILELKETRMVLKNVTADRNIKIGGGREAPRQHQPQHQPQQQAPEALQQPQDETLAESRPAPLPDRNNDRKRGQRRRGRRGRDRGHDQNRPEQHQQQQPRPEEAAPDAQQPQLPPQEGEEPKAAPSFISKLFPPPPTLIKETLGRYKNEEFNIHHEEKLEETIFEHPDTDKKEDEDEFEE